MTDRRAQLYSLLGDLPPRNRPFAARTVSQRDTEHYHLEVLDLDLNGQEPVPAYFTRPHTGKPPYPTVIYHHAHGGDYVLGKDEFTRNRGALQSPPWAEQLARLGFAGICADTWAFGERRGKTESEIFKEMLWRGQVMWGMMVYDAIRLTDYLTTRTDVDPARLAAMGISMGSTMSWWHAALDPRITVTIDICCLTDYQSLIDIRNLDGHGIYYYVPSLLKHFTASQINALIAPRPHLSLAGDYDKLTPPAGLDRLNREISQAYRDAGAPDNFTLLRYQTGHLETAAMRAAAVDYLQRFL